MRQLYLFSILFLLSFLAQGQSDGIHYCAEGKIRYFGTLKNNAKARIMYPGDPTIDVTYYGLDLNLTHTPAYLRGIATITLKSKSAGLSGFFLDLKNKIANGQGLSVDSVRLGNQRLTFTHEKDQLQIRLPTPLSNGQSLSLQIYYQGMPINDGLGTFVFTTHGPNRDPIIWSLSEPYGSSSWFPCKDTPADKADSSAVTITAPPQFVSVSNGTLAETRTNTNGTKTYRWRNQYPIAPYLISIAMTNYERYDTPFTWQGTTMPVWHYLYPESLAANKAQLDQTPTMLRIFSERFGPYPFLREKYGHAQFGWGGGMEHQTISSMGAFSTTIIAHELAHQWFGDKITCRDWNNIWLNEGFASFAEAMYLEATLGNTTYVAYINNFMNSARTARGTLYVQDISNENNIFNSARTYAKGAVVLHMLRYVVGDNTFFRILQTYAATPALAYNTAVTEDFQAVAEQVSGQKLDYFFKEWVYGENYPVYQVKATPTQTNRLQVQVTQTANTNPTSFTMPVQMLIRGTSGDTTVTVFNDRADQTFDLPVKGTVKEVVLDPNNYILKSVQSNQLVITALPELQLADWTIYPNPSAEMLTVSFTTTATGPGSIRLINLAGQVVGGLNEASLPPGKHQLSLNVRGLSAGRYQVNITTVSGTKTLPVLLGSL